MTLMAFVLKYPHSFFESHICNLFTSQGIFSELLKVENVIPLYKSDVSMLVNNYRPVSVSRALLKIFDKICTTGLQLSLKSFTFYMAINMDCGRSHQLMWHY